MIYHLEEPYLGARRVREWRRRALHTLGLLVLILGCATAGLGLLDRSRNPLSTKVFTALWNGVNLISTLGDFSDFGEGQKEFMVMAAIATMSIGAFAVTNLTGLLSGDDVMIYRENRAMGRKLDDLTGHVVVAGYRAVGELVAARLRMAGQTVLVLVGTAAHANKAAEHGHLVVLGDVGVFDDALKRARLEHARGLVVTPGEADLNLAITLIAHTINPRLWIAVPGENSLRRTLLESAGASHVVIADDLVAEALVGQLAAHIQEPT